MLKSSSSSTGKVLDSIPPQLGSIFLGSFLPNAETYWSSNLNIPIQEIQQELNSHEGALETIRLQAYKLLQGIGGCHVNAAAIHSKLDNMARRWDHLEKLAQERYVLRSN